MQGVAVGAGYSRYSLKSDVWKYMEKSAEGSRCKTCMLVIANCGNTTNYWNHLKLHGIKKPESAAKRKRDPVRANSELEHEVDSPGDAATAPLVTSSSLLTPSEARIGRKRSNIQSEPRQVTLEASLNRAKSFEGGGVRSAALNDGLLYMICKDHLPLSTPEKKGFRHFAKTAVPLWTPPSRQTVTRHMEGKHDMLKDLVKNAISQIPSVTLTMDVWTETHSTTSYLGGTLHFLEGIEMETCILTVIELKESHTASYLSKTIRDMCDDWGIANHQVALCVTDNAANIKAAVEEVFGADRTAPCFDHTLNLIPKYAIGKNRKNVDNVAGVPELMKKVKDIVTLFHSSVKAADALKQIQFNNGRTQGTVLKLVQSVVTRWSSEYFMLVRFLELAECISAVLLKFPDHQMLTGAELQTVRSLVEILKPFALITTEMSADGTTTAGKVIPLVKLLKQSVDLVEPPEGDVIALRAKRFILSEIDRRFGEVERNAIYAAATLLDPRFKALHFHTPIGHAKAMTFLSNEIKKLLRLENRENAAVSEEGLSRSAPVIGSGGIWDIHDRLVASQAVNREEDFTGETPVELRQYVNRPVLDRHVNPFSAWESMKNEYPHVYTLSRRWLSLVTTSVPSERLFSEAELILTSLRSRLTPKHLAQLLFLASVSDKIWKKAETG